MIRALPILIQNGYHKEATDIALDMEPCPTIFGRMGGAYALSNQPTRAIDMLEKAVALGAPQPNLARVYRAIGQNERAIECAVAQVEKDPTPWNISEGFITCKNTGADSSYFQGKWAEACVMIPRFDPAPVPLNGRLRIGIASDKLRANSNASFLLPFLRNTEADIVLFNLGKTDNTSKEMAALSVWVDLERIKDVRERNARIMAGRVHVLIDLDAHFGRALALLEHRLAPIQVSWFGYPGSPHSRAIDYRITDRFTDPNGSDGPETCIHTDGPSLAFESLEAVDVQERERGPITFGSFNGMRKIDDDMIDLMLDVLDAVPGSRLILKDRAFDDERFRRYISELIGADRCELHPFTDTRREHLELYRRVDIALDTLNYNGVTTTCEALSMGVPVVTLPGVTHQSRVAGAILQDIGPEWVAEDRDGYITVARDLARNLPSRKGVAEKFRAGAVCDGKRLAVNIDNLCRQIHNERYPA